MWIIILWGVCSGFYACRKGDYPVLLFSFRYIGKGSFVYRNVLYRLSERSFLFIGIFLSVCRNALFFLSEEYFSVYEKYSVPFHPGIKKASGMIVRRLCVVL